MKCTKIDKQLPLFVAGDLGDEEARRVLLHLENCEVCAAREEALAELTAADQSWLRAAVDETVRKDPVAEQAVFRVHAQVMANLDTQPAATPSRWMGRAIWLTGSLLVVAAAMFVFSRDRSPVVAHTPKAPAAVQPTVDEPADEDADETDSDWRHHWRHRVATTDLDATPVVAQSEAQTARTAIELRAHNPAVRILWLVEAETDGKGVAGPVARPSL